MRVESAALFLAGSAHFDVGGAHQLAQIGLMGAIAGHHSPFPDSARGIWAIHCFMPSGRPPH
jgi:hypothetical protein